MDHVVMSILLLVIIAAISTRGYAEQDAYNREKHYKVELDHDRILDTWKDNEEETPS